MLRRLTTGGCCVQPGWSPDGSEVWYIDRPSETGPGGLWAVPVGGGEPRFVTAQLGLYSPDRALFAYPEGNVTYIERVTGERWIVPSGGRAIQFSPDATRIAWQVASSSVNFDRRLVEVRIANVDGSEARVAATLRGGGLLDWLPDGRHLLVSYRDEADRSSTVALLNLADGSLTPLVEAAQLRGAALSPAAGWLAYQVTFSGDPTADGLWLMALGSGAPRRLEVYGAYRWRGEGRLLVIPLEPGEPAQRVVEAEAATGATRSLTDPNVTPLRIAGGDWALSPDGRNLAFVSADDHNLWVLELGE
jgi:Tol biopolymer transport system component